MKKIILALLIVPQLIVAAGDTQGVLSRKESDRWIIQEPAYGQFRLVPSRIIDRVSDVGEWNGPWTMFGTFAIELDFVEQRKTSPRDLQFYATQVGLRGSKSDSNEYHGTMVRFFDRNSTKEDNIKIEFQEPPIKIGMNEEYHAATISGDESIVTWKLFVRFTMDKPSYIRESTPE